MQNAFHAEMLIAHADSLKHKFCSIHSSVFVCCDHWNVMLHCVQLDFFSSQISFLEIKSQAHRIKHLNTELATCKQEFPSSANESAIFFLFPELDHTFLSCILSYSVFFFAALFGVEQYTIRIDIDRKPHVLTFVFMVVIPWLLKLVDLMLRAAMWTIAKWDNGY